MGRFIPGAYFCVSSGLHRCLTGGFRFSILQSSIIIGENGRKRGSFSMAMEQFTEGVKSSFLLLVTGEYRFAGRFPTPMPVPKGVRAAFHLECYGNRIACVVSGDVFDESDGIVTVFHEFLHCRQSDICEEKIKGKLKVAQDAKKANDHMWELNHPFPYGDKAFSEL